MGENTLGKLMKDAASMANIDKKFTNHSVRKTTVTSPGDMTQQFYLDAQILNLDRSYLHEYGVSVLK